MILNEEVGGVHAQPITEERFGLGEGPIWDHRSSVLRWVDLTGKKVCSFSPSTRQVSTQDTGILTSAVLLGTDQRLVIVTEKGVAIWRENESALGPFVDPEGDLAQTRFNDAKTSPQGDIFAGTMDKSGTESLGSLYRFGGDGKARKLSSGYVVSNGLGWSPDGRHFYFTDSARREIYVFDSEANGQLGKRRLFRRFTPEEGKPDGLTVDREGRLWIAFWDGWRVGCYGPDGTHLHDIRLPVQRPTSCAFGGEDLSTLYITTAGVGLETEALELAPYSGCVFAVECQVQGLPAQESEWPGSSESAG